MVRHSTVLEHKKLSVETTEAWEHVCVCVCVHRYHEVLYIIDTCQAESMFQRLYSPNILAVASSKVGEDSLSVSYYRKVSEACGNRVFNKQATSVNFTSMSVSHVWLKADCCVQHSIIQYYIICHFRIILLCIVPSAWEKKMSIISVCDSIMWTQLLVCTSLTDTRTMPLNSWKRLHQTARKLLDNLCVEFAFSLITIL